MRLLIVNIVARSGKILPVIAAFTLLWLIEPAMNMSVQAQVDPDVTKRIEKDYQKRIKKKQKESKRAKSNRKQIRENRYKSRSRPGERARRGDITGRRVRPRTSTRPTYRSPRPASSFSRRRIGGERSRFKPQRTQIRSATRSGERSRRGDISGRRIRYSRASSVSRSRYNPPNPYFGRKARPEGSRFRASRRSTPPARFSASRPPGQRVKARRSGAPRSISGTQRNRLPRNPFATSSGRKVSRPNRDIAGKKIRTRNVRSARPIGRGSSTASPYLGQRRKTERSIARSSRKGFSGVRTGSRAGERAVKRASVPKSVSGRTSRMRAPSPSPYFGRKRTKSGEKAVRSQPQVASISGRRSASRGRVKTVQPRSVSRKRAARSPRYSPYFGRDVNKPNRKVLRAPQPTFRSASRRGETPNPARARPRSISGSVKNRLPKNPYASTGRASRGAERSTNKDIAGRRLRTRNYNSPRPGIVNPRFGPYQGKGRVRKAETAGKSVGSIGKFTQFRGPRNNKGKALPPRVPGAGTRAGAQFAGGAKSRRPLKGGGSISGRSRNNKGRALPPRAPGAGTRAGTQFAGGTKAQRPLKGGGSISGRLRNNKGRSLAPRVPGAGTAQATKFRGRFKEFDISPGFIPGPSTHKGSIKVRKPLKGGGSVSARLRNNKGRSLPPRAPGAGTRAGTRYQGGIKAVRPEKGGGSISGIHNNKGRPIAPRLPGPGTVKGSKFKGRFKEFDISPGYVPGPGRYKGNIKAKRPQTGGGSVSPRNRNNKGRPLAPRLPGPGTVKGSKFKGRFKEFDLSPGYIPGPSNYKGTIKARRPKTGGGSISPRNRNNKGQPLAPRLPGPGTVKGSKFKGRFKEFELTPGYVPGPGRFKGNIRVKKEKKGAGGSVKYRLHNNKGRMLPPDPPLPQAVKASKYKGDMRPRGKITQSEGTKYWGKWQYFSFKSTKIKQSEGTEYWGKYQFFNFRRFPKVEKTKHSSSQFTARKGLNAKEEKEKIFSMRILWAKIVNIIPGKRDRTKKPRYDKGESEIWYE